MVEPVDATELLVMVLADAFRVRGESARVSGRVPNPRPDQFVRVSVAGGGQRNPLVEQPRLLFGCWDQTDPAAARLAHLTRTVIYDSFGGSPGIWGSTVRSCSYPVLFVDESGQPRAQFTAELLIPAHT